MKRSELKKLIREELRLNRKDIEATVSKIISSIEPYIVKGEKSIDSQFKEKEQQLESDWKATMKRLKDEGTTFTFDKDVEDVSFRHAYDILRRGKVKVVGNPREVYFYDHIHMGKWPIMDWVDIMKGHPKPFTRAAQSEQELNSLSKQLKKQFRDGELNKINVMFYRLHKINPTLQNYQMTKKYDGNEFTLEAQNEKGERIVIQTKTIMAGGYNIQRLHTRWLVSVKNSVTGKTEKFKITEKDKK